MHRIFDVGDIVYGRSSRIERKKYILTDINTQRRKNARFMKSKSSLPFNETKSNSVADCKKTWYFFFKKKVRFSLNERTKKETV